MKKGMQKEKNIVKRDKCMLAILKKHTCKEDTITGEQITKELRDLGFDVTVHTVHGRIGDLMYENWLPIVFANKRGYYWATKREDIEACVRGIEATIQGLEKRLRHLKSFLPE